MFWNLPEPGHIMSLQLADQVSIQSNYHVWSLQQQAQGLDPNPNLPRGPADFLITFNLLECILWCNIY